MTRAGSLAAVLAAALLVGCPLPQPLPESDTSVVVTPPRILTAQVAPSDTRLYVGRSCPAGSTFTLQAPVESLDTNYPVEARWFVDYDPSTNAGIWYHEQLPITPTSTTTPAVYTYQLQPYDPALPVHVVELVVSNGFDAPTVAPPNRAAQSGFETQIYRWVFAYVDTGGTCGTAAP